MLTRILKSPPYWHMNALLEVIVNRRTVKWLREVSRGRKSLFMKLEKESAKLIFSEYKETRSLL